MLAGCVIGHFVSKAYLHIDTRHPTKSSLHPWQAAGVPWSPISVVHFQMPIDASRSWRAHDETILAKEGLIKIRLCLALENPDRLPALDTLSSQTLSESGCREQFDCPKWQPHRPFH